ncbi:MAG: sodium-dependent transporter [Bacteroidales bacterium]|nr:sodium-dependent transporter [Bacteroidales bacterium]
MLKQRSSFSGSLGFVLAAAGSAVGLGNIWRFPYLAAKDGGGLFLAVYIILALTFGFALLTTEIAIGRRTKQGPLTAYRRIFPPFKNLGIIASLVPFLILPYYCVIAGWVLKYTVVFVTGNGASSTADSYFTDFITSPVEPIVYTLIALSLVTYVIYRGVNKGIESISKTLMPILIVLILGISIYSLTISYTDDSGVTRSGMDGLRVFVIPDFSNITLSGFLSVVVDAMGQLFFSLSVAMGIMISYGSYVKDDVNLVGAIEKIEIFDTAVAFLAGVMVIPVVFVFMGHEGMDASGPGLIFVSMPKIFASMGTAGHIIGAVFFIMVLFAALTSAISIMEAVVSSIVDKKGISRGRATIMEGAVALVIALLVCLGYNALYFDFELPNGSNAQILDILDYVSNNLLMPLLSLITCVLIGWVAKPEKILDEITKNGEQFKRRGLYVVMIKYIAPILLAILLLRSFGII